MLEIRCVRDPPSRFDNMEGGCYLMPSLRSDDSGSFYSNTTDTLKTINHVMAKLGLPPIPENSIAHAIFDEPDQFSSSITCLLFSKPSTKEPRTVVRGLMLQNTAKDQTYRRVGMWVTGRERPDLAPFWASFERRTVTLI